MVQVEGREDADATDCSHIEGTLPSSEVWGEYETLQRGLKRYGLRPEIILLPEVPVSRLNDNTRCWVGTFNDARTIQLEELRLAQLRAAIQQESGGPVYVGQKGLTYGTSAVECYLSRTDSAYPGDVDCVIVDESDLVRCVIEYKKHTLNDVIGAHLINRYYPMPDGRKYQRLNALVRRFQARDSRVAFVILYYSTKRPELRLQEVGDLLDHKAMIVRDSGELTVYDRDPAKVGATIMAWMDKKP